MQIVDGLRSLWRPHHGPPGADRDAVAHELALLLPPVLQLQEVEGKIDQVRLDRLESNEQIIGDEDPPLPIVTRLVVLPPPANAEDVEVEVAANCGVEATEIFETEA